MPSKLPLFVMFLLGSAFLVGRQESAGRDAAKTAAGRWEGGKEIHFDLGRGVKIDFVLIPAGSFLMGDSKGDDEEKPVHRVTISKPFYLGKFAVTQQQWEALMGSNPSHFKGAKSPVDRVSWEACQTFIKTRRKVCRQEGHLLPADRGRMGICLPGGIDLALQFRRSSVRSWRVRLVRGQRGRQDAPGRPEEAERLGTLRHARQRLAVVRRLVRRRLLQELARRRPDRPGGRHVAGASRRLVERPRPLLPPVVSLLPAAVVLRPLLRRAAALPLIGQHLELPDRRPGKRDHVRIAVVERRRSCGAVAASRMASRTYRALTGSKILRKFSPIVVSLHHRNPLPRVASPAPRSGESGPCPP